LVTQHKNLAIVCNYTYHHRTGQLRHCPQLSCAAFGGTIMETASDRRSPGAERIPFDGLVEVGGSLGPTFEAQARDLSRDGLGLHAAYLPELGQPLSCRFESGTTQVICEGEVAWKHDAERGGEFGIRFTNLDRMSEEALTRLLRDQHAGATSGDPLLAQGTKLRLHIDGLGAPMRARVKDSITGELTAYSDLSFLKLGKEIEFEDATTGGRREARIDDVELELHPETRVPQLLVSLSYGEGLSHTANAKPRSTTLRGLHDDGAVRARAEGAAAGTAGETLQAARASVATSFAKVTPALSAIGKRAQGIGSAVFGKLQSARKPTEQLAASVESPTVRRTTAPAPTGGLHTAGRKIQRNEGNEQLLEKPAMHSPLGLLGNHKRKAAVGVAALLAVGLAVAAGRKSDNSSIAATALNATADASAHPAAAAPASAVAPAAPIAAVPVTNSAPPASLAGANLAGQGDPSEGAVDSADALPGKLQPFGHGTVANGNVLRLKMDGKIERLQGAAQPTGFTVVLPKRRGVEAAATLLRKDSRIAEVHLNNQPAGAEISMTFKDGVPPYLVRAKGDTLEFILGRPSDGAEPKAAKAHVKPVTHGHGVEPASHRSHPHR
jgi:PilZ domain